MQKSEYVLILAGLLIAALMFPPSSAFGQNASGSLAATVMDPTGAVVPNAKVVLRNEDTGADRDTATNGSGFFNLSAIQPGSYALTINAPGFSTWQRTGIVFNQGESRTLPDVTLQVGAANEHVQVEADANGIAPVDTGESRQTLDAAMVNNLPIEGRDAAELIKIMPGMGMNRGLAQNGWTSLVTQSNSGPVGQYSANGTQPYGGMTVTMDGANLVDPGNMGTQVANINKEQTSEVTLLNSAFGAEYAKGPVTFQAIGKSGTAHFHGQLYVYGHLSSLDSVDSLSKAFGGTKLDYSSVYPGGEIGGPVVIPGTRFSRQRDKLFFYIAPEGMNQAPAATGYGYFLPTAQMLQGNFSPAYIASLGTGFASDHGADAVAPTLHGGAAAYPGGYIPQSLLDPTSLAYAKIFPALTTQQPDMYGNDYYYVNDFRVNRVEFRVRLDYNISDNTKAFFSWNRQDEFDHNPFGVWYYPGNTLPYPSAMPAHQVSNIFSANLTHIFSPTLTNETVATLAEFLNPVVLQDPSAVDPNKLGLTGYKPLVADQYAPQIPNIISWGGGIPGYYAPTFGTSFYGGDFGKMSMDPSVADNLSWVAGTHTMKFGAYWDFARNYQPGGLGNWAQGMVEFENTGATTTGNIMADFLTGRVQSFQQVTALSVYDMKYSQYSLYAQDQWKAHRRLTLTYGVRMDHMGQWYPTSGPGLAVWDPASYSNTSQAGAWTGLVWHGLDSKIPISGFPSRLFFPEPRFGMAFDVFGNGKTVIRGGFGVYRFQISYNTATTAGIYDESANISSYNLENPPNLGWNFAQYGLPAHGVTGLGGSIAAMQQGDSRTPYTESYNLIVSQRAPWRSTVEIEYAGNQSHDLLVSSNSGSVGALGNLNKTPFGAYFRPDPLTGVVYDPSTNDEPLQDYRPYQNYQTMVVSTHGGYQNYNALQASWNKRSGRATFMVNYTFGKALGIRDGRGDNGLGNGVAVDPWSLRDNYGPLAYDHTQIFNAAYVVTLPKPVHGNPLLAGVVNGWAISGMTQLQSGAPIQPNTGGTLNLNTTGSLNSLMWLGTDSQSILPALTCDPRSGLKSGQYFNPNCFALAPEGTNGPTVWPYIRGPHYFNSDLSIYKTFQFKDRHQIEFRVSSFNFLNHPLPTFCATGCSDLSLQFTTPAAGTTNSNALTTGSPEHTTGYRVVVMMLKYKF
jgi:hypothetical protein